MKKSERIKLAGIVRHVAELIATKHSHVFCISVSYVTAGRKRTRLIKLFNEYFEPNNHDEANPFWGEFGVDKFSKRSCRHSVHRKARIIGILLLAEMIERGDA